MTDLERARNVFSGDRFAAKTGCVIEAVRPGWARCSLTLTPDHLNAMGRAMGGALYTLADFAYAVASNFDRDVFVTTSSDIHFLTAVSAGTLTAEARQIRCGRRACLFEITISDEDGRAVACGTSSGMLILKRKGSPES